MDFLLPTSLLLPLTGLVLGLFPANKKENAIFWITILAIAAHLLAALGLTIGWFSGGRAPLFWESPALYGSGESAFRIDLFFDLATVVYGCVASAITFMVAVFSRYYMHRERGFKRFFNNLLFFYFGLNVVLFAGNFETLFIGWEIVGMASFFLIAFYRERYLPVKNALKVVSLYRFADIGLLLGIWFCHHVFSKSISFPELFAGGWSEKMHGTEGVLIASTFLLAALVKSAQLPFSSWLPRAMEGPTTSSAVFYGSLASHLGVLLLLRTWPFYAENEVFRVVVGLFGLATSLVATSISRVQSTVKTQLAYSSIAQIGLMFVEVAAGWHGLALAHFVGNAFLRTYQLLVSPSVLNYLIHDQFFHFEKPAHGYDGSFFGKIKASLFVLSVKEWGLDGLLFRSLWLPLKKAGRAMSAFLGPKTLLFGAVPLFLLGLFEVYNRGHVPPFLSRFLPEMLGFVALALGLRAFVEREKAQTAGLFVISSQLFTSLSIAFNEAFSFAEVHLFLSGILVCAGLGFFVLKRLEKAGQSTSLDRFHGHSFERPRLTAAFLIAAMGLAGFPVTPTFLGEELLLGHVHEGQWLLMALTALGLIVVGLAVFRIYARVFLGPHEAGWHETAYRSS